MPDIEPSSTYRLQLHAGFGFAEAEGVCEYLGSMGITHLYLSPILQAAPGSMHGYDVVDHSRINAELGGYAGLTRLAGTARRHGMGLVVDVVPNHMAFPTPCYLNRAWWATLRDGRGSPWASWFDIDWDLCGGRVGLPILGSDLGEVLDQGQLVIEDHDDQPALRYYDQVLPLADGTSDGRLEEVLSRQHYVLASWRDKDTVLGYRRFFDVDTLIAVRVELPHVFEATHRVLLDLYDEGVIDGFRIDHPDGLADPEGYLDALHQATGKAWVVVEKILVPGEQLPASWRTSGTTGYDAITAIQTALVPGTGRELDALWTDRLGVGLSDVESRAKREILHDLFTPEVLRLIRRIDAALPGNDVLVEPEQARSALTELLVHIDRYRAYIRLGIHPEAHALHTLETWVERARASRPQLRAALDAIAALLVDFDTRDADTRDLIVRFQQVCGPVMAKGIEDTTFYRFHRFIALNEVGGDPDGLMHASVRSLHDWALTQVELFPLGMTTLTTHDTKRDEDVRARLLAAGEDISRWTSTWEQVANEADELGVDLPTAYLVFQTVLGAWPIRGDRLDEYLQKAIREAKQRTTWTAPDESYESLVMQLGARCVKDDGPIGTSLRDWVSELRTAERAVNLSAKLIQLTLPGVPDIYQGTEQTKYSLVDPDNRRPVDFAGRARRLAELRGGATRDGLDDDKLWVTSQAVQLRRMNPEVFGGTSSYRQLELTTPHAIGFERSGKAITLATRWPRGLQQRGWQGATVALPAGEWIDELTDARHHGEVALADVLSELPVALLVRG